MAMAIGRGVASSNPVFEDMVVSLPPQDSLYSPALSRQVCARVRACVPHTRPPRTPSQPEPP
jgi:hypothetical protein